jgi:polysaccharide export outer membrane protein
MALAKLSTTALGDSRLQPGDLIEVTTFCGIAGEDPKPQTVRIDQRGVASVPIIGDVTLAGIDEQLAAGRITAAAIERQVYHRPQVTVKIAERAVHHVTVLGAVASPGTHRIPRGSCNVVAALAAAGGLTDEAGTEIEIMRRQGRQLAADQPPVTEGGVELASFSPPGLDAGNSEVIDLADSQSNTATEYRLGDQDVVMVRPARKQVIHVLGLVRKPSQFDLPADQEVHVLDALALAGGKSSPVADKVLVIRRLPDEPEPAVIQVSLNSAKLNGAENLRLAPGDVVSVEATALTSIVDTMTTVVRVTAGVGGNLLSF